MHYYKRNLGDYAKKAGRLSMLQHGAYNLLLDTCYDREEFPTTLEQALEWTWASTKEEVEAVTFVLKKFFSLEGGVYIQKRIQEELEGYRTKSETNKRIALERETNRAKKPTKRARTVHAASPAKSETLERDFEQFWSLYPKKVAKPMAIKAFKAAGINGNLGAVLADIEAKKLTDSWLKDGGKFIPNPATYLNQQRWCDETAPQQSLGSFI